ncbi:MAG: flagellar basal body rod protein FlgB [Deltaproteobacteria bacterium]|nr:MAG: flagellar basal body rod protein FlgB [Deltaproteobacteria bacterium]
MADRLSFTKTFLALERAVNIVQQRHTHITSNISNLDTPNYRAKDIDFKTALAKALESGHEINLVRTNPGHIDLRMNSAHRVEPFEEKGEWTGFNWVNIDKEMTRLIENNLVYRTAIETLLRKIAILREVIREGGR